MNVSIQVETIGQANFSLPSPDSGYQGWGTGCPFHCLWWRLLINTTAGGVLGEKNKHTVSSKQPRLALNKEQWRSYIFRYVIKKTIRIATITNSKPSRTHFLQLVAHILQIRRKSDQSINNCAQTGSLHSICQQRGYRPLSIPSETRTVEKKLHSWALWVPTAWGRVSVSMYSCDVCLPQQIKGSLHISPWAWEHGNGWIKRCLTGSSPTYIQMKREMRNTESVFMYSLMHLRHVDPSNPPSGLLVSISVTMQERLYMYLQC